jgi:hypothetical protein
MPGILQHPPRQIRHLRLLRRQTTHLPGRLPQACAIKPCASATPSSAIMSPTVTTVPIVVFCESTRMPWRISVLCKMTNSQTLM